MFLNHRHEHRQDFNVYIKQYNTETGYLRLTLSSTKRESERKPIKFFSQEPRIKATSKHDASWLWLVTILWPRRLRCCDLYITTAIKFMPLTAFYKYFHKSEPQEPKCPLSTLEVYKKLLPRLPMFSAKSLHLSEWHICIICLMFPLLQALFR